MKIEQFEDKGLSHFSYAILSECQQEIVLIDPGRNPHPYYEFAARQEARITGIIETHPHADFVSSHLEIHQTTGAPIYAHSLACASYPHQPLEEGDVLEVGKIRLKVLHTPGHSPDGISIVLEHDGKDKAVFTGDTLFIGEVGRPDLREEAATPTTKKEELARQLFHSTRHKLLQLADEVVVYPAHGAGTLCGKGLREAKSGTIGQERKTNPALHYQTEEEFIEHILEDQPFIPHYFAFDVALNRQGAPGYQASIEAVPRLDTNYSPHDQALLVDGRPQDVFKKGHHSKAINIQEGLKFETWLGSLVRPDESFYLVADTPEQLETLLAKAANIGYEGLILGAMVMQGGGDASMPLLDLDTFRAHPDQYTLVDIRNASETAEGAIFEHSLRIPLPELRERTNEIPRDKPVVVHCSGGYRSAAGSSLVAAALPDTPVYNLGEAVTEFL